MGQTKTVFEIELTSINCGSCGGTYAINERYREKCKQAGSSWNCPYCRVGWGYSGNSDNEQLRKQLAEAKSREELNLARANRLREERDQWANRERGQRAAKTRIKNRISKGVCPCCNRSFSNLHRHMSSKHPDYAGEKQP